MPIDRITIISIPVRDQAAAKQFYTEVLGFTVVRDNPMGPAQRWVQLQPVGGGVTITLVTWFEQYPAGSSQGMVLEVDDVAATYAELQARGLELGPLEKAPWGQFATFHDPDGNGFVIQQSTMKS